MLCFLHEDLLILHAISMMKKGTCCDVHRTAEWLLIIGGVNWGLVGALNFNLIDGIFSAWDWLVRFIYLLVGLSAIAMLFQSGCAGCKKCDRLL